MTDLPTATGPWGRRQFFIGLGAGAALLALPGCESYARWSLVDAIRRLLMRASENAFARLTAPDGFYDDSLARLDLPSVFGSRGNILTSILTSVVFKQKLERAFNHMAEKAAYRAAPAVADAVRVVGIQNAIALVKGGPESASLFLRENMGQRLVEVMVPELGDAMRLAEDPIVSDALRRLSGVDVGTIAQEFAGDVDNAIWRAIGREEAAIRANPQATNDPMLIGVFGMG